MRDLSRGGEALPVDDGEREEEAEDRGNRLALLSGAPAVFRVHDGGGAEPLGPEESRSHLAAALEGFPRPLRALIALSGGPDSVALLLAAAENAEAFAAEGLTFRTATVDHGLRTASAEEARFCAELAGRFGIPHEILVWDGPRGGNLAAAARAARYRLLEETAMRHGCAAILAAHHRDDQIETHCLARRRGAGVVGLAGMRARRSIAPGLWLVRPFLGLGGARLKASLAARGQVSVDDPSNRSGLSARARLRATLPADAAEEALAALGRYGAERRHLENRLAASLLAALEDGSLAQRADGTLFVGDALWAGLDGEARFQWMRRIVWAVSGAAAPPEGGALARLARAVDAPSFRAATLAGVALARAPGGLLAAREFGRAGLATIDAAGAALFDGRYEIEPVSGVSPSRIEAFGHGNAALKVLPVQRDGEGRIVAGHPALRAKLAPGTASLRLTDRLGRRLFRDLPGAEPLSARLLETIRFDSRLAPAANPPPVVGKPRVSTYLRCHRPGAAERGPRDDG